MKLTADLKGNVRHFSAKLGWKERFDPKEIEMLSMGAVPMLIAPASVQGRKNNIIQFDISPYSTLEFYLSCILSREQFAELLIQSVDVLRRMQRVYLSYKNLVFDLDKVYVLLSDRTIHFIYLPLMGSKREASIPDFFKRMISRASRSTYEQSSFLDACLAWLGRSSSFVLDEFESFVKEQINGIDPVVRKPYHEMEKKVQARQPAPPDPIYQPVSKEDWGVLHTGSSIQGGTGRLDEPVGGTALLGADTPPLPAAHFSLLRTGTGEKIELTHFPFLVGTELGAVSYRVTGNSAVSRRHAEFTMQDGKCVVTDQKSTNKTYVNDCALVALVGHVLQNGDQIRMGNENFMFIREEG